MFFGITGLILLLLMMVTGLVRHPETSQEYGHSPTGIREPIRNTSISTRSAGESETATGAQTGDSKSGGDKEPDPGPPAFSRSLAPLVAAADNGHPTRIRLSRQPESPAVAEVSVLWTPQPLLADGFSVALGLEATPEWGVRTYRGMESGSRGVLEGSSISMAVVDGAAFISMAHPDGQWTFLRSSGDTEGWQWVKTGSPDPPFRCLPSPSGDRYHIHSLEADPGFAAQTLWTEALPAEVEPEPAAQGGFNPANGYLEKYVQPVPSGELYERSLKPMFMMAVLDKEATGGSSDSVMQLRASEVLAMISNTASVYENQLGIRLHLQELVLTPAISAYADVPGNLEDFADWCASNRPQATHRWSSAVRWGGGLEGNTLGIAYLRSIQSPSAVCLMKTGTGWATLAHEMGHNLGSEHTNGGIMNAFDNGGGNRDFFTDVIVGETAAMSIFRHASSRLPGQAVMRNPREIPFAVNDSASGGPGELIHIPVLDNDRTSVRYGLVNSLSIAEVSRILPPGAGTVDHTRNEVVFQPSSEFTGTAFFSYTVQGDQGNGGDGWFHKGDVAVVIGDPGPVTELVLAPGESVSIRGGGTGPVTVTSRLQGGWAHASADAPDLLVVRAGADATGSEVLRYRQGNSTYAISILYDPGQSFTVTDVIVWDRSMGSVTVNPLANDHLAGRNGVAPLTVSTGLGTSGRGETGPGFTGWNSRMISARLVDPDMGRLVIERLPTSANGRPQSLFPGNLTFTPDEEARGLAAIEYVVEDAALRRMTNYVSFILPLAELENTAFTRIRSGNHLKLNARTFPSGFPPLSGQIDVKWQVVDMPHGAQFIFEDDRSPETVFMAETPGFYRLKMTASDGDYRTDLYASVFVDGELNAVDIVPRNGLVAHWPLDELAGGSFPDSGPAGRPLFHRNAGELVDGISGRAVRLDGGTSYLRMDPYADVLDDLSQMTLAFWFRTADAKPQTLFSATSAAGTDSFFQVMMDDGFIRVGRQARGDDDPATVRGTRRLDDGQWHHMVLMADGSGLMQIAIDAETEISARLLFLQGLPGLNEVTIGARRHTGAMRDFFNGDIDQIRIYRHPMAASWIESLISSDLPSSGVTFKLSDHWVVPAGQIDPQVFLPAAMTADAGSTGFWQQLSGPEDINRTPPLWMMREPGDYRMIYRNAVSGSEISHPIRIQVVQDAGTSPQEALYWAVPTVESQGLNEFEETIDLSGYLVDPSGVLSRDEIRDQLPPPGLESLPSVLEGRVALEDWDLTISIPAGKAFDDDLTIHLPPPGPGSVPVRVRSQRFEGMSRIIALTIPENHPPGSPVASLPSLIGIGEKALYRILDGNALESFEIDRHTGDMRTSEQARLNFEGIPLYQLTVEAVTAGGRIKTELIISLRDVNEPFQVFDQAFEVELRSGEFQVGKIEVHDPERRPMEFRITDGDPLQLFRVEDGTGALILTSGDAFAETAGGLMTLQIEVRDPSSPSEEPRSITVTILGPQKAIDGRTRRTAFVPVDNSFDNTWRDAAFDDSLWARGIAGVGYERGSGYAAWIGLDMETAMFERNESVYVRIPFEIANPSEIDQLTLRMYYDDGFAAWINGRRVASSNAPANPVWNSGATQNHPDQLAVTPEDFTIDPDADGVLVQGSNILCIQGLNNGLTSSDMLIYPELIIRRVPAQGAPVPPLVRLVDIQQEGRDRVTLTGEVLHDFGRDIELTLYYGRSPGGVEEDSWEHSMDLGRAARSAFTRSIPVPHTGEEYFFRLGAAAGSVRSFSGISGLRVVESTEAVLVSPSGRAAYRIPDAQTPMNSWMATDFDDRDWLSGFAGFGYEDGTGFGRFINTPTGGLMAGGANSVLARFRFMVDSISPIERLKLSMMYDDGFAAYLNGTLVASSNIGDPGLLDWDSVSQSVRDEDLTLTFETHDLTEHLDLLIPGINVLAIHAVNVSSGSSDFLLRPRLSATLSGASPQLPDSDSIDSDRDSLPDAWELDFFETLDFGSFDDPDGNGLTAFEDLWAGNTADPGGPLTPGSGDPLPLSVSVVEKGDDPDRGILIEVRWPAAVDGEDMPAPDRIEYSTDLRTWRPWEYTRPQVDVSTGGMILIADPLEAISNDESGTALFFRRHP